MSSLDFPLFSELESYIMMTEVSVPPKETAFDDDGKIFYSDS